MSSHDPNNPYSNQPPYGGQQAYGAQAFPGQMPPYGSQGGQIAQYQATKDAQTSWILGLVGLFVTMGIILGPIAIHYANKAERGGAKATLGRVLGWLCIIEFVFAVLAIIAFFMLAAANQN